MKLTRIALLLELIAAGLTPPATIPNDALFTCVDAVRRKKAGEFAGDPFANPVDAIILHHPTEGPLRAEVCGFPLTDVPGPELDVWDGKPVHLARALFCLA